MSTTKKQHTNQERLKREQVFVLGTQTQETRNY
jgi:hypothetical protein